MNEGQVQHVETYPAGGPPLEDAPVGATEIHFEDAVDYDEDGGEIRVGGVVLAYDSADLDLDIIYLSAPLTFPVTVQDIVEVYPPASETVALVADQEGEIEAVVPYPMRPLLPDGPREPGEGESVLIQDDEYGRPTIVDIPTVEPSMDAYFVSNAHELLMENRRRLGEVLTENEDRVTDARDRLGAAEGRITDAFSEIELKPDQDYVDAAKQQAIDAAAIDAQARADAAEADAVAAVEDVEQRTLSRGADLVTNGTGYLQSAYNFPSATFSTDAPVGAGGSFEVPMGSTTYVTSEAIPVDPSKAYLLAAKARFVPDDPEGPYAAFASVTVGLRGFDAYGNEIRVENYMPAQSAIPRDLTLAQPLNPGDTYIIVDRPLTPGQSNFYWALGPYTDPGGRVWPLGSYTRKTFRGTSWSNTTPDRITGPAYTGDPVPAGTPLFPMQGGGFSPPLGTTLKAGSDPRPWQSLTTGGPPAVFTGAWVEGMPSGPSTRSFPPGCAAVKISYQTTAFAPGKGRFAAISLSEAAAAKAEAIDAAADDAAAKAAAAQSAAEQAAQAALAQAQTDLQQAIASGDAAAIADAEAKIATAKQEAIAAAEADATAKAAEAMQKANAALTAAQSAQATADNAIRTYYSETPPWDNGTSQPDDVLGDMWYKDSTGQAYRWNGTTWKVIQDASIGEALAAAQNAQTTADGKITAYYQPNEPLEGDEGDLWFDTDDDSALHRRTGGSWSALLDPKALADAAEQAAKTAAAADATAKAEAAEAAAAQTAAADATAKANQARADAEAAAQEYADQVAAGEGSGALAAAKEYAEQKAADAQAAAEAAAAADATAKAEAAEAAAAATAAADATAKADAAKQAAIDAAAADATEKADAAEQAAIAFATTRTDGLAKTLWSTSLPGTTTAPQDSVWYQVDGDEKIIAVFTQTAAGSAGNTWVARPIRSEAIDNLDVGKLTAFSGTINELVANTFATKLANIIEANIGNLTVTGDTHLDNLVAQTIAGDTASFMNLTVDQILAGFLQAEWIITESGAIIAGNPDGARVEIRHDGVRVYVVGPNGDPYEAVSMVNGEISFAVIGQDGTRLGGISSTGAVSGTTGTFSKDVKIKGTPVLGQVGGGTIPGWLDNLPRGVIARNYKSTSETSIVTGVERGYLRANATLYPGRQYRIRSTMRANLSASGGALTLALRWSTTAPATLSSAQLPNTTTFSFPNASANHRIVGWAEGFLEVDVVTKARFLLTYKGDYGATPAASSTYLYVEDVGPTTAVSGGDEEGPDTTLYRTTWRATATRRYYKSGEAMPSEENGKIETWYWFGVPTDFKNVGVLFSGGAVEATDSIEMGKTFSQALNGATIHKSEIFLKNKIWNSHDEGYLALSSLSGTSLPSTKTIDSTFWGGTIEAGEGVWVEVPTSWFTNGANRGICIGDKDGAALDGSGVLTYLRSGVFHGINDAEPPLIRHTYSR